MAPKQKYGTFKGGASEGKGGDAVVNIPSDTPKKDEKQKEEAKKVPGVPYKVMTIGAPKEVTPGETRVAMTPTVAAQYLKQGFSVVVEKGAGAEANFLDCEYEERGAKMVDDVWSVCDIIVKILPPTKQEAEKLRPSATLVCLFRPTKNGDLLKMLTDKGCTVFALDCMPRVTRAQAYDVLSSMANIAGYKAVVEAANHFGRFLAGQITAAGKVAPAKVLILGTGVAGLAAIGAARGMGAIVRATDARPVTKEQVQSMGAEFLEVRVKESGEGQGGYAKEMSDAYKKAQAEMVKQQCAECDIVITTALIPNRPAPTLITKDMVDGMKEGSVIVDLAAENGGNVETTKPNEMYTYKGVLHIGYSNLATRMPTQASTLFSNNVYKFLMSVGEKQHYNINLQDEVVRGAILCHEKQLLFPAPPVALSQAKPVAEPSKEDAAKVEHDRIVTKPYNETVRAVTLATLIVTVCGGVGLTAPGALTVVCTTFALACIAGYQVVWGVTPALHSPLMSVTNAISGMVVIGGLVILGPGTAPIHITIVALFATLVASINIFGGFEITKRMLDTFTRPEDPKSFNYLFCIPMAIFLLMFAYGHMHGIDTMLQMCYLVGSTFCIMAIAGLAAQSTSRRGNAFGMIGTTIGVGATLFSFYPVLGAPQYAIMLLAMAIGGTIGFTIASRVDFTDLPQLIAGFHSFVGIAAVAVAFASFMVGQRHFDKEEMGGIHKISIYCGTFLGGITFTGSLVAFGKLQRLLSSAPLKFTGQHVLNIAMAALLTAGLFFWMANKITMEVGLWVLGANALLSFAIGGTLIGAIGGADVPVAITVLNSYSGWAMAAEGFMLQNNLCIIVGALVGSSGAILSYIMCVAMNRSLANVLLGGMGSEEGTCKKYSGTVVETTTDEVATWLKEAKRVMIVVGYGMAVAKAQYAISDIVRLLRDRNAKVEFCIHPVAGRMPGQMNVLLAEARVPYDIVKEMDEVNDQFSECDICLVVGANDTINSAAVDDPGSSIYGMPVCHVWEAKQVVVVKRTLGSGFAGVDNPVFFNANTAMLLEDAKKAADDIHAKLTAALSK